MRRACAVTDGHPCRAAFCAAIVVALGCCARELQPPTARATADGGIPSQPGHVGSRTTTDSAEIQALIEQLKSSDEVLQQEGATRLAELGQDAKPPVPWLIECLRSERLPLREAAAIALGRAGDQRAVEPLMKLLDDPDDDVRAAAATGLGTMGAPLATPAISKLTALFAEELQTFPKSTDAAAAALARIGSPALPALLEALDSERTREGAATAAARMGPRALPGVEQALRQSKSTAIGAVAVVMQIGPAAAPLTGTLVNAMRAGRLDPCTLAEALSTIGPGAKDATVELVRLLQSDDSCARRASATALAAIGPGARVAVSTLKAAAAVESDVTIRAAMQEAIERIER